MAYAFQINLDSNALQGFKQIESGASELQSKAKSVSSDINKNFDNSFNNIGSSLKTLVSGFIALEGVKSFFKIGTEMEQTNISFEVMLGSVEKAKDLIGELQQFSIATPFTSMYVNEAAKMLLNYGVAQNDILSDLQKLGDASGGNAEKFKNMTYAFAQISATGRLMGQDLRQLVDAGFNPLQEMSRTTGKSIGTLKKEMEDGLISSDDVKKAFTSATSEGGRFYKMMDKQSRTVGGLWSTFIDSIQLKIVKLFNQLAPVFKKIITSFTELSNYISPILEVIGNLILKIIHYLEQLWPVLKYIIGLFAAWKALQIFDSLIMGVISFYNYLIKLPAAISEIGSGFSKWTMGLAGALVSIVMIDQIMKQIKSSGQYGNQLADPYRKELGEVQKEQFAMEKKGITPSDSIRYKELTAREDELSTTISDLEGSNGYMTRFFKITTEQVKGMLKGLADKLDVSGLKKMGDFKPSKYGGGVTANAINTSALSGASGGLGEAKIIKIDFHKALQEINIPGGDGKDVVGKSTMAVEILLRVLNNIAYSQGATM